MCDERIVHTSILVDVPTEEWETKYKKLPEVGTPVVSILSSASDGDYKGPETVLKRQFLRGSLVKDLY